MKIQRTEFKSIIKECLKELITEGALDHMVAGLTSDRTNQAYMNDPRVKMAAAQIAGGNPQQMQMMEQILADTAMHSLPEHQAAMNRLPNGMPMPGSMGGAQQEMLNEYSTPQRNPLPPRDMQQRQQQATGAASRWANLAFNSPISNRPQSGAGGTGSGFLPGAKKGSFE